jgi:hypothetical protein
VTGEDVRVRRTAIAVYQYLPRRSEENYKHLFQDSCALYPESDVTIYG